MTRYFDLLPGNLSGHIAESVNIFPLLAKIVNDNQRENFFAAWYEYESSKLKDPAQVAVENDNVEFLKYCLRDRQVKGCTEVIQSNEVMLLQTALFKGSCNVIRYLVATYNFRGKILNYLVDKIHDADGIAVLNYLWDNNIDREGNSSKYIFHRVINYGSKLVLDWLLDHNILPKKTNPPLRFADANTFISYQKYVELRDYFALRLEDKGIILRTSDPIRGENYFLDDE